MRFTIISWNLGYGGMGEESSFIHTHDSRLSPPHSVVEKNIQGICGFVAERQPDAFLLQEVATGSLLNRWHDLHGRLTERLQHDYHHHKAVHFSLPFLPDAYRCEHSLMTAVRAEMLHSSETQAHTAQETYARLVRRNDSMIVTTIEGEKPLHLIHVHFAAFDTEARVRRQQLEESLDLAQRLSRNGPVVIGGDWNMRFPEPPTPFDRHPFMRELVPPGWTLGFDANTPTVRSGHRPLRYGVSTSVIDGFLLSPGVSAASVTTHDLGFRYSDHNPVEIVIET